ncbi:unnamed protein product, partial [Urochloa humidicola]
EEREERREINERRKKEKTRGGRERNWRGETGRVVLVAGAPAATLERALPPPLHCHSHPPAAVLARRRRRRSPTRAQGGGARPSAFLRWKPLERLSAADMV